MPSSCEQRFQRFLLVLLTLTLSQFWKTRSLWLANGAANPDFPQIPLVPLPSVPMLVDRVCFGLLIACMLASIYGSLRGRRRFSSVALFIASASLGCLFVLNQHRLQPWAYLFWLFAVVSSCASSQVAVPAVRALIISVYLFSAWSKFDFAFVHGNGQQFLGALFQIIGVPFPDGGSSSLRAVAAIPFVEVLVGVGLSFRATRRWAIRLGIAMHCVLFLILGPLGMGHTAAVLTWNVLFVLMLPLLFLPSKRDGVDADEPQWSPSRILLSEKFAVAFTLCAIAAPLLQPIGFYDHWPSWALYASRNSRARIFVGVDRFGQLPSELTGYLASPYYSDPDCGKPVCYVNIARWSFDELRVPIYPQSRYQLAVALALADRYDLGDSIFVQVESASDRLNGIRKKKLLAGVDEIRDAATEFTLNTQPRQRR